MNDNKVVDLQKEAVKRNARDILSELYKIHKETGECGIYDITPNGTIGEISRRKKEMSLQIYKNMLEVSISKIAEMAGTTVDIVKGWILGAGM